VGCFLGLLGVRGGGVRVVRVFGGWPFAVIVGNVVV
jgi:hypothetical protein